jgi:hypothetical protein
MKENRTSDRTNIPDDLSNDIILLCESSTSKHQLLFLLMVKATKSTNCII